MKINEIFARVAAVLLIAVLLLPVLSFGVYADYAEIDEGTEEQEHSPFYNITCVYDASAEKVKISYRMTSDDVKKYENGEVFVFALPVNKTPSDIESLGLEPVLTDLKVSNRSDIEIPAKTLYERLSSYVIVIRNGHDLVCSDLIVPPVEISQAESKFKGIDSSLGEATDSRAKTAILQVDTGKLDGGSAGYLFSVEDKTYIFSSSYLEELDRIMTVYSGAGCDVYIRLVCGTDEQKLLSHNYEDQRFIYACVSFLASRYSDEAYRGVAGFILGGSGYTNDTSNVNAYAASVYAAALGINDVSASSAIVMPVGDVYSKATEFISALSSISSRYTLPKLTVMVESERAPYGINNTVTDSIDEGVVFENGISKTQKGYNVNHISSETLKPFLNYLRTLASRTGCVYSSIIYNWTPSADLSGNAAVAAYVYNFYRLYFETNVISYIASLNGVDPNGITAEKVSDALKYVDSNLYSTAIDTNLLLEYFGITDWENEIAGFSMSELTTQNMRNASLEKTPPKNVLGTYDYFDFSSSNGMTGWYEGSGCLGIAAGKSSFSKGLMAKFKSDGHSIDFVAHNYKYSESFKYTDIISVEFSFEGAEDAEYSVYIILGGEDFCFEFSADEFVGGKKHTVYLDVENMTESSEVEYIRIGAVSDSDEEYRMYLYSVKAESFLYDDKEFAELIDSERERLKTSSEEDRIKPAAIALFALALIITAVVMIMVSRRTRQTKKHNNDLDI